MTNKREIFDFDGFKNLFAEKEIVERAERVKKNLLDLFNKVFKTYLLKKGEKMPREVLLASELGENPTTREIQFEQGLIYEAFFKIVESPEMHIGETKLKEGLWTIPLNYDRNQHFPI